jgi:Phosphotransferase enzyme family
VEAGERLEHIRAGLARALAEREAIVVDAWREGSRVYVVAESPRGFLFARQLEGPDARRLLDHETAIRAQVETAGPLRTPPVLARGPSWMVEKGISGEPWRGPRAMDVVAAAAERIAGLQLPSLRTTWRPLRSLKRRFRLIASGTIPVRELMTANRVFSDLSLPNVSAHGDFHPGNVMLLDEAAWVVDWELSGPFPAGYDLMQFWAGVEDPADRRRLFELAVEVLGSGHRRELLRLRYVVVVRTIANILTTPFGVRGGPHGLAAARPLLAQLPVLRAEADLP